MMKTIKTTVVVLVCFCLMVCFYMMRWSKVHYYFNDVVSFRLENESEHDMYVASVFFGTKDTVFGTMSGENADGAALANKGKECLVFSVEQGDMNDAKLEDMVFEFFVCTKKDSDFTYVGTVTVTSSKLHQTYTLTLMENDGKLVLTSSESNLNITIGTTE